MRRVLRWLFCLLLAGAVLAVLCALGLAFLYGRGLILESSAGDPEEWEVFGVDVSTYQGAVDWPVLVRQGVDFAFIKATEGSSLRDVRFAENWAGALEAGVRPGAYHFFSYDSPGERQAENFIATVPRTEGALPPVVDVEFYGDYLEQPAPRETARAILDPLLERLEDYYGVKPILYCTYRAYRLYLSGGAYADYPLWISSPRVAPLLHDWTFWQYSHTARLEGYDGHQDKIDLNVFRGTREEFETFGLPG